MGGASPGGKFGMSPSHTRGTCNLFSVCMSSPQGMTIAQTMTMAEVGGGVGRLGSYIGRGCYRYRPD